METIEQIKCPKCNSTDIIKNLFNFEKDKPRSVFSDYSCMNCDHEFNREEILKNNRGEKWK